MGASIVMRPSKKICGNAIPRTDGEIVEFSPKTYAALCHALGIGSTGCGCLKVVV